ncbi:MAG: hypothetical protein AB8B74_11335 [Crocinitomicaceae bacterium]
MRILLLFTLFIVNYSVISCKKRQLRINGCNGLPIILTEYTKNDSIYFLAPNVFLPGNENDANSNFNIFINKGELTHLKIYKNRKLVFTSTDILNGWNGKYAGKTSSTGNYKYEVYLITDAGKEIELEGEVTLINPDEYDNKLVKVDNCESCIFPDMIDPYLGAIYYTSAENIITCN